MKLTIALVAALATTGIIAPPAHAQIAAAIGRPLPSDDLPIGTITVKVVAGAPSKVVVGVDVTLTVNGTPRVARTDEGGRANFPGLPPGATVQARVFDEDKKAIVSEAFAVAGSGGSRVMLTTKPWQGGGGGGAPFAGGGGGGAPPEPRQMSGETRDEQSDPPGTLTVRVMYDDFKDTVENVPVALVGYTVDDTINVKILPTDKEGRAKFEGLDKSGGTVYFAMTELPRGAGIDRMISIPAQLDSRAGARVVLSAAKRTSTEPPIDDINKLDHQNTPPPAGTVVIALEGQVRGAGTISLINAASGKAIATTEPKQGAPDPTHVMADAEFEAKSDMDAGTLGVVAHGGPGTADNALPNVTVAIFPIDAKPGDAPLQTAKTGADGSAQFTAPPGTPKIKAAVLVNGKPFDSKPIDLSAGGGVLDVVAHWEAEGHPEGTLQVPFTEGQVVYGEVTIKGQQFRSLPFQLLPSTGTRASIYIVPQRILFSFRLSSELEDQLLGVQGRFEVVNYSWMPFRGGPDGLVIPLPKGFKGAIVAETDQADVGTDPVEGFRIIRPIGPGSKQFHAGFSLPVDSGEVNWSLDLPYGTVQSGIQIREFPGMTVQTPPNAQGQSRTIPQGTFYLIDPISIPPKQAMVMSVRGLPSVPLWRLWAPRMLGLTVVMMMLGGVCFALFHKKGGAVHDLGVKRAKLMDELVELERTGSKDSAAKRRKEALMAELETLWGGDE